MAAHFSLMVTYAFDHAAAKVQHPTWYSRSMFCSAKKWLLVIANKSIPKTVAGRYLSQFWKVLGVIRETSKGLEYCFVGISKWENSMSSTAATLLIATPRNSCIVEVTSLD